MRKVRTREEWEQYISEYRKSGQSAFTWAKANEVNPNTLKYWIRRINQENADKKTKSNEETNQQWLSIPLNKQDINCSSSIILRIGAITIEVSNGFDKNVLADVLSTIQNNDRCN